MGWQESGRIRAKLTVRIPGQACERPVHFSIVFGYPGKSDVAPVFDLGLAVILEDAVLVRIRKYSIETQVESARACSQKTDFSRSKFFCGPYCRYLPISCAVGL